MTRSQGSFDFRRRLADLGRSSSGHAATEYAILLGLIVVAAAAAITRVGQSMDWIYGIIKETIPGIM